MTRRKFIGLLIFTAIGILILFFAFLPFEQVVRRILKNDAGHLKNSDEAIDQFIRDAKANGYFNGFDRRKKWLIRVYDRLPYGWLPLPFSVKYKEYRSNIVGDFLLSTDFFLNSMDEQGIITYIGYYEPYRRPCSSPFSNLYYTTVSEG